MVTSISFATEGQRGRDVVAPVVAVAPVAVILGGEPR
jgi:hypothetical protein